MAETTLPSHTASAHDEWMDPRWRTFSAVVGALVVLAGALMVTLGMRPVSYGDLVSDVASGSVDRVHVVTSGTVPEDSVELRWTVWGGLLDQYAVVQVGGSDLERSSTSGRVSDAWREPVYSSDEDPRETLRSINENVQFTSAPGPDYSVTFLGWRLPGWLALLGLGLWVAVLLLIVSGPPPRRATRWAWFWLWLFGPPLTAVVYLLFGGPLARRPMRPGGRRLTGGWAFLIAWVLFASSQ